MTIIVYITLLLVLVVLVLMYLKLNAHGKYIDTLQKCLLMSLQKEVEKQLKEMINGKENERTKNKQTKNDGEGQHKNTAGTKGVHKKNG